METQLKRRRRDALVNGILSRQWLSVMRKANANSQFVGCMILWSCLCAAAQDLQITDVPATGLAPNTTQNLLIDPAIRDAIDKAVKSRDYRQAEALLLEETQKDPKSAPLFTTLGNVFFLDGDYLQCAIAMKKAEAIEPLDNRSRFTLALAYIILKQPNWARPELEKLVLSEPENPNYPYWLGRLDYDAQQFGLAVGRFKKALELDPQFMKAYDNLALCYEALGKYDEAVQIYQDALRLNRQSPAPSPWPPLNLGALLVKLERLQEARAALEESLRADPRFPKAHYQMGVLLEKEKKDDEAIREFNLATTYDPMYPDPHYILARIYQRLGENSKAKEARETFQKLKEKKRQQ